MNSVERVKRAITFATPDRVPMLYFNSDKEKSDIIMVDVVRHFEGENADCSEWGFVWERQDGTMGQPKAPLLTDWADVANLQIPDPYDKSRFAGLAAMREAYTDDRYYLASLVLTGFTIMTFLRGFCEVMVDLYTERENIETLADIVFGFEEKIIQQLSDYGFNGVAFFDDWGTQDRLLISPAMWREVFKPRYQKLFDLAHQKGLDVYFHCCGYIADIIPDFIELGVDMLNISQPNLFDLEELGRTFGGEICFVCPVSYQTTSVCGTRADIFADVRRLRKCFCSEKGGLIGYIEEYSTIGMSDENYRSCIDAFEET